MTYADRKHYGKRNCIAKYTGVRYLTDPPDPLPICHPCHGCPAVDLSCHRPYCFLPACMRADLEKPPCTKEEVPHA